MIISVEEESYTQLRNMDLLKWLWLFSYGLKGDIWPKQLNLYVSHTVVVSQIMILQFTGIITSQNKNGCWLKVCTSQQYFLHLTRRRSANRRPHCRHTNGTNFFFFLCHNFRTDYERHKFKFYHNKDQTIQPITCVIVVIFLATLFLKTISVLKIAATL